MADELYDESFHVNYPAWLLVHKKCIKRRTDGTARFTGSPKWLLVKTTKGEAAVPVFTDDDVALRYCEAAGLVDEAEIIDAQDEQKLADMLQLIGGMHGATLVVLDLDKPVGSARRFWPLDYVVEKLREGSTL